jgi:hypothetical protein
MNIYRAHTQSITYDEAFSYLSFISTPFREMLSWFDANNHVLNTLLAKLTTAVFGVSEFTLRLPSLGGGALFLFACQRFLFRLFAQSWLAFLTYCAAILNPMVLDYLSAARGYSLALGFQFCALWLLASDSKPARNWFIGVSLGLSVASNLTFIIPNLLIVAVWLALNHRKEAGSFIRAVKIAGALALTATVFLAQPLRHATSKNFYVGCATITESLASILNRSFGFPDFGFGLKTAEVLTRAVPVLLLGGFVVILVALLSRRLSGFLVPLVFAGSIASLAVLHLLFGVLYPYERTGLYLIPLATITLALSPQLWFVIGRAKAIGRIWGGVVCLFLGVLIFQYLIELKVNRYEEWTYDAGTKRVLLKLREIRSGQPKPERLGVSWVFEKTVNCYREVHRWNWLAPVSRDNDPHQNSFDSYYLRQDDFDVIRLKRLNVVYTDPVSGSVLALPASQ